MANPSRAIWNKLKHEYITTDTTLRGLVRKYGVSAAQVNEHSAKEKWVEAKKEFQAKAEQKAYDQMVNHEASRIMVVDRIADKLLAKIEKSVDELEIFQVEKQKERKEYTYNESGDKISEERVLEKSVEACQRKMIDRQGLKAITSALKDIKEIKMLQSALADAEQRARIEKLKREVSEEEKDKTVRVVFGTEGDDYGV